MFILRAEAVTAVRVSKLCWRILNWQYKMLNSSNRFAASVLKLLNCEGFLVFSFFYSLLFYFHMCVVGFYLQKKMYIVILKSQS